MVSLIRKLGIPSGKDDNFGLSFFAILIMSVSVNTGKLMQSKLIESNIGFTLLSSE